jgi:hypothetical protein
MTQKEKLHRQYYQRMDKRFLATKHKNNGGLLTVAEYMKWTKDELINTLIEDDKLAGKL